MFVRRVQMDGLLAWDVFVNNVQKLRKYYGIQNEYKRREKLKALSKLMERCNALLCYWPLDEELLEIQITLSTTIQDLMLRNYQQNRVYRTK